MRYKNLKGEFKVYAVTGTNAAAFAIDCDKSSMKNLLGFAVEKEYYKDGKKVRKTVEGYKVFKETVPKPKPGDYHSTFEHPIQSFTWEDFSSYPGMKYKYYFTPLYGSPKNIGKGNMFSIDVETEPAWKENDHSVFFNRGVASSQAYANKFGNKKPSEVKGRAAYKWLSRGLEEAIYSFIAAAKNGDELTGCFYEFHYADVLIALKKAAQSGVKVNIIYDAKDNEHKDSKTKKMVPSFPKEENLACISETGLDKPKNVFLLGRTMNKSYICHNKFLVLVRNGKPVKVWTGSTNISEGGIFGQSNVGHSVSDPAAAKKYIDYWTALRDIKTGTALKAKVESIEADIPSVDKVKNGVTCIFSPRKSLNMLGFYADLLVSAKDCACITLAFGVNKTLRQHLMNNTPKSALTFLMLEKDEAGIANYEYKKNIVKAVGSYLDTDALAGWTKEVTTQNLGLNTHVRFVHTKFMLKDPLGSAPVVVSGSYNFSEAATVKNDENMVIIKGSKRAADIYYTEFMRIFGQYYFRWVFNQLEKEGKIKKSDNDGFLKPDDSWTQAYMKNGLKRKKIEIFEKMAV
ncbi:MAG: phospholipase D-like domain-containing protein [Bacteroidetes bacterium]|nr:phospholipase D-like domain-containing protein [Bacteroidota bacterium]